MNKEGSFKPIAIAMILSMLIALFWSSLDFLREAVHFILDPSAGSLINWNLDFGMMLIILILSLITTLIQKYTTDQNTLRELKKEQKEIQKEMQKFKDHPEKMMELQKKSFESLPKTLKLSMRSFAYTAIPLILFFRWFMDFFNELGNPSLLGFMNWFWFYLIFSLIFSSIFRKVFKTV